MNTVKVEGLISNTIKELYDNYIQYSKDQPLGNLRISVHGFNSLEEAKQIVNNFPKFVKVKTSHYANRLINEESYIIEITINALNNTTGEINETGDKRLTRFVKGLKDMGIIA
jgi:hypothetical protein